MATSGSITCTRTVKGGAYTYTYNTTLSWSRTSISFVNNTSTINWTLTTDEYYGLASGTVTINGQSTSVSSEGKGTVASGSLTISHNTDGSKSFTYSLSYKPGGVVAASTYSNSGTGALDTIPRPATITKGQDFTDEGNPTITYSCPGGNSLTSVQACISFTGAADDISYRDIPKTGTSYTFNLTATERSKFWPLLDNGTTATVRFYIKSTYNNETVWSNVSNLLTFVNYKPVITPIIEDINSDTLALTGDKYTLVKYMSEAYYKTQAVARKGADLVNQSVRNIDTYYGEEGTISHVRSNTFYFEATDTRGDTTNTAVVFNNLSTYKWVDYIKLTCNIDNQPLTASGNLVVTVSGKYFNGSFGTASNKLTIEYNIFPTGSYNGDWTNLGVVTPTMGSDGNYTYSFTISGLDYVKSYELSVRASDELTTGYTASKLILSTGTLFDWSKEDFAFNIPVALNNSFTYPQTMLWSGVSQLGAGDSVELSHPISEQPVGAVLVFSLYRDGVEEDVSVHSFFISKAEIKYLLPDVPRTFMMGINSNLSVFGSKYVYVSDSMLTGFSGNTASGTATCGITFDNTKFVLRYVIGV